MSWRCRPSADELLASPAPGSLGARLDAAHRRMPLCDQLAQVERVLRAPGAPGATTLAECADVVARARWLAANVTLAVGELEREHEPFRYVDNERVVDADPAVATGCTACYPGDSSWPCMTRAIAADLAGAADRAGAA